MESHTYGYMKLKIDQVFEMDAQDKMVEMVREAIRIDSAHQNDDNQGQPLLLSI